MLAPLGSRLTEVREGNGGRSVLNSALDVHTCSRGPLLTQITSIQSPVRPLTCIYRDYDERLIRPALAFVYTISIA